MLNLMIVFKKSTDIVVIKMFKFFKNNKILYAFKYYIILFGFKIQILTTILENKIFYNSFE